MTAGFKIYVQNVFFGVDLDFFCLFACFFWRQTYTGVGKMTKEST